MSSLFRSARVLALVVPMLGALGCGGSADRPAAQSGLVASAQASAAGRLASAGQPAATAVAAASSSPAPSALSTNPPGVAPLPSQPAAVATDVPLRVRRLVLARGIEGREPVAPATAFSLSELERLYAFVEVENPEQASSEVVVTFEPAQGPAIGHVRLSIGAAPRWRTWAFTRAAKAPGAWTAVVRDAHGDVLARTPFEIRGS